MRQKKQLFYDFEKLCVLGTAKMKWLHGFLKLLVRYLEVLWHVQIPCIFVHAYSISAVNHKNLMQWLPLPFLLLHKWTHVSSNIHRWREISNFENSYESNYYNLRWGESITGNAAICLNICNCMGIYPCSSINVMAWWVTKQSPIFLQYWSRDFFSLRQSKWFTATTCHISSLCCHLVHSGRWRWYLYMWYKRKKNSLCMCNFPFPRHHIDIDIDKGVDEDTGVHVDVDVDMGWIFLVWSSVSQDC